MNVTLTAEQKASIVAAVEALETTLGFRVSLDNTERRRLYKLGSKSEGFVREALEAARNHTEHLPPSLSLDDLDRDVALREVLLTLVQRVGALHTQLVDTHTLAGSDLMHGATRIYRALRANAEGAGIDNTLAALKRRFEHTSQAEPEVPEEDAPSTT
jgi:hypothetical protein